MRMAIAPVVLALLGTSSSLSQPTVGACSLLTRELAAQYSTVENKVVLDFPPEEQPVGRGTLCDYAAITLQLDVFTPQQIPQLATAADGWSSVAGVGDGAFFRDNGGLFAELMAHVGTHTVTLQVGVPTGGTAESVKPNVVGLARAIVENLR